MASSGVIDSHAEAKVQGPGVVTGRYGTLGEVFYIEEDFWPLNTALYVQDFKGNDRRFVSYFLRTLNFDSYSGKSAVPGINRNDLHQADVHWPTLSDQREIAKVLSTLDDKIDLNRHTSRTLKTLAESTFRSWFVEFDPVVAKADGCEPLGMDAETAALFPDTFGDSKLGPIPEGWGVEPFSSTVAVEGGGTPRTKVPEYWGGSIPWFSVVDTPSDSDLFVLSTDRTLTQKGMAESAGGLVPEGTTILTARGTVGNLALTSTPMTFNQSCYGLVSDCPGYTYFSARHLVDSLQRLAHGSVFDTITRRTLSELSVVVPPRPIVRRYEEICWSWLSRIRANVEQNQTLAAIRDLLLLKLLSGEIRVTKAQELVDSSA